jgi:hypothetical protein
VTWWLLALAIGGAPVPSAAEVPLRPEIEQDEALFCSSIKTLSGKVTAELPIMADRVTRVDGMAVLCAARAVVWSKFVIADLAAMTPGWRDVLQHEWNDSMCANSLYAAMMRKGWRFTQNLDFRSGEHFVLEATCSPVDAHQAD